jgi:hypothetical protein
MLFVPGNNSIWQNDSNSQLRLLEIEEIEQGLANAGIEVPRTSRLDVYRQAAQAMAKMDTERLPSPRVALNLMTELRELRLILQEMPREPEVPGWQAKMRMALGGNVLSAEDVRDSSGRDAQYELFLASAFRSAGFDVTLDEPDVTFQMDGQTLGIAAKRLKSEQMVEKRVRSASKQIARSGHVGIIALDITYLCDLTKPTMTNHIDGVHRLGIELADEFALEAADRMISGRWLTGDLTFCLMVCVNTRVTVMESLAPRLGMPIIAPKPVSGFRWTMVGLGPSDPLMVQARLNVMQERLSAAAF